MGDAYDISFSHGEASTCKSGQFYFGDPNPVPAPSKPPVRIGSLPKLGPLFYHLTLAVTAAVLVHLAIYLYNL